MHSSYHFGKTLDLVLKFEIAAFLGCTILIALYPSIFRYNLQLSFKGFFIALAGAIIAYALVLVLNEHKNFNRDIKLFHRGVIGRPLFFKFFWYPLLVSVPEELLFRLVLPSIILITTRDYFVSAVFSSLLFGAAHIRKGVTTLIPIFAFAIGLIFVFVLFASDNNILTPILAHLIFTILRVSKFGRD